MTISSGNKRSASGFTLNWFLKDDNGTQMNDKLPARQEDWENIMVSPNYKSSMAMLAQTVKLAQHLRTNMNISREQILEIVIKQKISTNSILWESKVCSAMNVMMPEYQYDAISKLLQSFEIDHNVEASANTEDARTGFAIFYTTLYCPSMDIKLFNFIDKILSTESSRTIIQANVNLFHSRAVEDPKSISRMNAFYVVLAKTLDLKYGNILLSTSTKSQLQAVIDNDWPFFTNNTDLVKDCLLGSDCDRLQNIIQDQGLASI